METTRGPELPPECPAHRADARMRLYTEEFAADPDGCYTELRRHGPAAPVELSPGVDATLVTGYSAALHVLQNPDAFAKDSRRWRALNEGRIPADSPMPAMLGYRPNAMFSDGADHLRLRQAVTDSLAKLDPIRLSRQVDRVATYLIDQFSARGSADLLNDYAKVLPLLVFNDLFGCPAHIGDRLVSGMQAIFDGVDSENANAQLSQDLLELIALKRSRPGEDVTSWLIAHPAGLDDAEMVHQLVMLMGAGTEPERNLIANALLLLFSDEKYGGELGGGLLVEDAIDDVLWNAPPIANYAAHYPVIDTEVEGVPVRAGDPVLISFAAANTDPVLSASRQTLSKRAHLAWGAGPHSCPAKDPARLIAVTAMERLLNQLPDVELAVPAETLTWRQGPFHRALIALPARFTPVRPRGAPATIPAQRSAAPVAARSGRSEGRRRDGSWWSSFLAWFRE